MSQITSSDSSSHETFELFTKFSRCYFRISINKTSGRSSKHEIALAVRWVDFSFSKWLRVLQTIQISYEYFFIQQDIGFSRTEFCHKSERASSSLIGKRMSTIQCLPTTRTIATQALHVAAYYGQPELVELLLEAGANPWHKNRCLSLLTLSLFRCASIS